MCAPFVETMCRRKADAACRTRWFQRPDFRARCLCLATNAVSGAARFRSASGALQRLVVDGGAFG